MKFDSARASAIFEKLGDPAFAGPHGEGRVADFVAGELGRAGWKVERREVTGSRFPQRAAPWIGWLGYGVLITTAIYMFACMDRGIAGLGILPLFLAHTWLTAMLNNLVRWGRGRKPIEIAPLVVARPTEESPAPVRVVFQSVLGGVKLDFLSLLARKRPWTAMILYYGLLVIPLFALIARLGARRTLNFVMISFAAGYLLLTWFAIVCILVWEIRQSRAVDESQYADRRGLAILLELARSWPRNRSTQIEPVFVAAGGQQLDYAGSREVIRLLESAWPPKPSLLLLQFDPGAGGVHCVGGIAHDSRVSSELPESVAKSLWIPIDRWDPWTFLQFWPLERRFKAAEVFVLMGSGSAASSAIPFEPKVLEQTSQLATEIALRWAKMQREKPATSEPPPAGSESSNQRSHGSQ